MTATRAPAPSATRTPWGAGLSAHPLADGHPLADDGPLADGRPFTDGHLDLAAHPSTPADDPYAHALRAGKGPLCLRTDDGRLLPLEVARWCAAADSADLSALRRCEGPVLDVGCGPGRLVAALAARGRRALGIDVSAAAVAHTLRGGGAALCRSVFDPLPGEGRWGTVLLLDGNLGIGGDPAALLARTAALLAPHGLLIAETHTRATPAAPTESPDPAKPTKSAEPTESVEPAGPVHPPDPADPADLDERLEVRLDDGTGTADRAPFPWARVGSRALLRYALPAGWSASAQWSVGERSFVALRRP
ncbi:methyltransferase domain-containing protein [Streptomyces axinellae]|uniref:Class I SAM-dependent methyltransferase n=1 Tax=Streptomyces axinellae TaxID=552788 RepID=A0ABP6CBA2_9ACTN